MNDGKGRMRNVAAWILFGSSILLMGKLFAAPFQGAARITSTPAKPAAASTKDAANSGYDDLLSDIEKEENAELRLERYWEFTNNPKASAAGRKIASEKWQQLFQKKVAAEAAIESAKLYTSQPPEEWDKEEKSFQDAITSFPSPELRSAFGMSLLRRASHEIEQGKLADAAVFIGRAQELGADKDSVQSIREQLQKREDSWGGKSWAAAKQTTSAFWTGLTGILGSAHVWALLGIGFAIWLYRKLRGNARDWQLEPFIVVQQHDADAKEKVYPGLTARLLKEMKRVAEIHQGSSQKALDEISDPLGNSIPINFTEYEPELTSTIEQIPEISVGTVKLPVVSYLSLLLRANAKRVRTYYEEFTKGPATYLRLIGEMRTGSLVVLAEYKEEKAAPTPVPVPAQMPPAAKEEQPGWWQLLLRLLHSDTPVATKTDTVPANNEPPQVAPVTYQPKEEVLDRLITKLACEVRFARIADEKRRGTKNTEESYSRSADIYSEFTLGLDAQHEAAQIMHKPNRRPENIQAAQLKIKEASEHYDYVIGRQSDHAAAYFCRAGICMQHAQIIKALDTYVPDTPSEPAQFDLAPARTKIDEAIDDYRAAARFGQAHLRGLSFFNMANIFYRIHRCDAYGQALGYADKAETDFEIALNYLHTEASELRRRVWLLKIAILADRDGACAPCNKRQNPKDEVSTLLSKYREEDPDPAVSEYWRVTAKVSLMEIKACFEKGGPWNSNASSHLARLLHDAEKQAKRAIELDSGAAENYNTYGSVLFARLLQLNKDGKNNSAERAEVFRQLLAAYDRACALSTHEFFFYNRAITRKNFNSAAVEETLKDFARACATIANGQRSSIALFSCGDFLSGTNKKLAEKFMNTAALDREYERAQGRTRKEDPVAE